MKLISPLLHKSLLKTLDHCIARSPHGLLTATINADIRIAKEIGLDVPDDVIKVAMDTPASVQVCTKLPLPAYAEALRRYNPLGPNFPPAAADAADAADAPKIEQEPSEDDETSADA